MSLFKCSKCGGVDNTAITRYWFREDDRNEGLCSECDPKIGRWHNAFPKESASNYLLCNDGFLITKGYAESPQFKWRAEHQGLKVIGPA